MMVGIDTLLALANDDAHAAGDDLVIRFRFIEGDVLICLGDGGPMEVPDAHGETLEEALAMFLVEEPA